MTTRPISNGSKAFTSDARPHSVCLNLPRTSAPRQKTSTDALLTSIPTNTVAISPPSRPTWATPGSGTVALACAFELCLGRLYQPFEQWCRRRATRAPSHSRTRSSHFGRCLSRTPRRSPACLEGLRQRQHTSLQWSPAARRSRSATARHTSSSGSRSTCRTRALLLSSR